MFAQEKFKAATDAQGRLIVPNAELMVLELMIGSDRSQTGVLFKRMQTQLQDYYQLEMPSTQRRFLMHRLEELYPRSASFPTLAAEDLAARYLESTPADPPCQAGTPHNCPMFGNFPHMAARWCSFVIPRDCARYRDGGMDAAVSGIRPCQRRSPKPLLRPASTWIASSPCRSAQPCRVGRSPFLEGQGTDDGCGGGDAHHVPSLDGCAGGRGIGAWACSPPVCCGDRWRWRS